MQTGSIGPAERLFLLHLPCCHREMAQCLARHRWHWQRNHSQMCSHWSAGRKVATILLRETKAWGLKSRRNKKKKSSNNRIGSNMSSKSSSHLSQVWVFAVGNWAAPRRWRSFPPHTGIPIKLGGTPGLTPAGRRDPGEHNRRSRRMQINLHRVTSFPK